MFVGPSGCGKTTTLRLIAGFEEPDQRRNPHRRHASSTISSRATAASAWCSRRHALFPHKTVAQNIEFGLRMKKVPRDERARRVREVAEMVRLTGLLDKLPGACSGGESQRVALARTLVTNPSTFLLDEPLSSLDAKLRRELRAECDRLHQELKKTFIFVTHDQEEAMTLADRIVVMRDGDIEQIGSPMEIYSDPVTDFVADFFGSPSMNLIAGEIDRAGGAPQFRSTAFLDCAAGAVRAGAGRAPLRSASGPSTFACSGTARPPADLELPVRLVEPLGKDTLLYFDIGVGAPVHRDQRRPGDGRDGSGRPGRADPDPRLPLSVRSRWPAHRPRRRARRAGIARNSQGGSNPKSHSGEAGPDGRLPAAASPSWTYEPSRGDQP